MRLGLRLVKGLANAHAAELVAHRGGASLHQRGGGLAPGRRTAHQPWNAWRRRTRSGPWASTAGRRSGRCGGLADTVLPLFAAADAGGRPRPEIVEVPVELMPMRDGREVVEDYGSTGLTLRQHPVAFLRDDLRRRGMMACGDLLHLRNGRRVVVPGIVLVRQKPGSAKGVMFITVEDETGVANLVLWPDRYAAQRSLVLSASMLACHGRVQREGEVVHVIADRLENLSDLLRSVGERDAAACLAGPDPRRKSTARLGASTGIDPSSLPSQPGPGIRVPTRDFR